MDGGRARGWLPRWGCCRLRQRQSRQQLCPSRLLVRLCRALKRTGTVFAVAAAAAIIFTEAVGVVTAAAIAAAIAATAIITVTLTRHATCGCCGC